MTTLFLPARLPGAFDPTNVVEMYTTEAPPPPVFGPDNVVPTTGSVPMVLPKPQVLPTIDVTVPGGHLLDITPKVISTETRVSSMPWWVWALIAVGAYMVLSGKAGRRRSSW